MTYHSTTWWKAVCDGCGTHEDLGAGLDPDNLPLPEGWLPVAERDGDREYCSLACAQAAQHHCAAASGLSHHAASSSASTPVREYAGVRATVAEVGS